MKPACLGLVVGLLVAAFADQSSEWEEEMPTLAVDISNATAPSAMPTFYPTEPPCIKGQEAFDRQCTPIGCFGLEKLKADFHWAKEYATQYIENQIKDCYDLNQHEFVQLADHPGHDGFGPDPGHDGFGSDVTTPTPPPTEKPTPCQRGKSAADQMCTPEGCRPLRRLKIAYQEAHVYVMHIQNELKRCYDVNEEDH